MPQGEYEPSPERIEAICAGYQREWTDEERQHREGVAWIRFWWDQYVRVTEAPHPRSGWATLGGGAYRKKGRRGSAG